MQSKKCVEYAIAFFESNVWIYPPRPCNHYGTIATGEMCCVVGHGGGRYGDVKKWPDAMGIDWMTKYELTQAIPPAYTEWIGRLLIDAT